MQDLIKDVAMDLIVVALVCMLLDIITGTLKAFLNKEFKSSIFREGLYKKLLEVVIILVGYLLDYALNLTYIGKAVTYMVIGMEAYSIIIENASEYIPMPDWLKEIIDKLKGGNVND